MGVIRPNPTVTTVDGSTTVKNVDTIKVSNGDLSVSGRIATVDTSGDATIGGTIAAGQIAFGDGANSIAGSDNFKFTEEDASHGPELLLKGNKPVIRMEDDTDATDYRAELLQSGNSLYLNTKDSAGGNVEIFRIKPTYTWFNRGAVNMDFWVGSDAYDKMFQVDAGLNKAHFGTGTIDNALGLVQINVGNSTQNGLTITSEDGDASQSPTIELYRKSATPENSDLLGELTFAGNTWDGGLGARSEYVKIYAKIDDRATGSPDGEFRVDVKSNGTFINALHADRTEVVINEDSMALNTRIESNNNTKALFIDGSNDTVGIMGDAASDADVQIWHTNASSFDSTLRLRSTDGGSNAAPRLEFYRDSGSGAAGDKAGEIVFSIDDTAGGRKWRAGSILMTVEEATPSAFNSWMQFGAMDDGVLKEAMLTIRGDANQVVVNEHGNNTRFRIEGDHVTSGVEQFFFYADTVNGVIGINSSGSLTMADTTPSLQVNGSITGYAPVIRRNDDYILQQIDMRGQINVITDGGTTAFTVNSGNVRGSIVHFVCTSGQITVTPGTGVSVNGGSATVTRATNNEIYTMVAVDDDVFVLNNPA